MRIIILKLKERLSQTSWNSGSIRQINEVELLRTIYHHYGQENVIQPKAADEYTIEVHYVNPNRSDKIIKLETDNLVGKIGKDVILYTVLFKMGTVVREW